MVRYAKIFPLLFCISRQGHRVPAQKCSYPFDSPICGHEEKIVTNRQHWNKVQNPVNIPEAKSHVDDAHAQEHRNEGQLLG